MRTFTPYRKNESVWDFMSEVERALDDMWRTPRPQIAERGLEVFTPTVDLQEKKDSYLVSMDLPGLHDKDIKIDVKDGRLSVSGERRRLEREEEGLFRRFERSYGRFERTFALPQDVDQDKIQAHFESGVLEILIPKAEVTKPRSIEIKTGARKLTQSEGKEKH